MKRPCSEYLSDDFIDFATFHDVKLPASTNILCWCRVLVQLLVQLRREMVIDSVHVFNTREGVK